MTRVMIAIPCLAKIDTAFVQSLINLDKTGLEVAVQFVEGSLVYDARNILANIAIKAGFDQVLWVDSDMILERDTLKRLNARMDEGRDFVAALAFRRRPPHIPVIYSQIAMMEDAEGRRVPSITAYEDYPENDVFDVAGSGFGCVMTSVELLRKVRDEYGLPFSPRVGFGEDISFCMMAHEVGTTLWCDSSVKVKHIGTILIDEEMYKETRNAIQRDNSGT